MRNIIFIGGVYGAGKNFLLESIKLDIPFIHLTASKVLKWKEISDNPDKKLVHSITNTQDILVENLKKIVKDGQNYLLDGHFTLLNKLGEIEKVPMDTFMQIAPKVLIVKTSAPDIILQRLKNRDNQIWDLDKILNMQKQELEYAQLMSIKLKVPFYQLEDNQEDILEEILRKEFINA